MSLYMCMEVERFCPLTIEIVHIHYQKYLENVMNDRFFFISMIPTHRHNH